jgi:hypothetical protein
MVLIVLVLGSCIGAYAPPLQRRPPGRQPEKSFRMSKSDLQARPELGQTSAYLER